MKKTITVIFMTIVLSLTLLCGCTAESNPIRIHIRANSDALIDQAVKLIVRDAIVEYLSVPLTDCCNRDVAYRAIESRLSGIKKTADATLSDCGFGYNSYAYLSNEYFPDKDYGEVTYPAGYYDALIIELGSGTGGNWWCVAFPPLCFYGNDTEDFKYSSLIAELLGL